MLRTCRLCHEEKDIALFNKRKDCRLGYVRTCKACKNSQDRERRLAKKLPLNVNQPEENEKLPRLNKVLRNNGWGSSRRWVDNQIINGLVLVNGKERQHIAKETDVVSLKLDFSLEENVLDKSLNQRKENNFFKNELMRFDKEFIPIVHMLHKNGFGSNAHISRMIEAGIFSVSGDTILDPYYPFQQDDIITLNLKFCNIVRDGVELVSMDIRDSYEYNKFMGLKFSNNKNAIEDNDRFIDYLLKNNKSDVVEESQEEITKEIIEVNVTQEFSEEQKQIHKPGFLNRLFDKLSFWK